MILGCDYSCKIHNCIQYFMFLSQNKRIPFLIMRPFILNEPYNVNKLYYLSFFREDHLSDSQKYCLNKIKTSIRKNLFSEIPFHPSTINSKIYNGKSQS
jgi:hypothetical protein